MTNITIRTDDEIAEKIGSLAKAMDRPRNWVIEDAMNNPAARPRDYSFGPDTSIQKG